jgi:hypothetical protein
MTDPNWTPPPATNPTPYKGWSLERVGYTHIGHVPGHPDQHLWSTDCQTVKECNRTGIVASSDSPAIITEGRDGPAIQLVSQYDGAGISPSHRVECTLPPTDAGEVVTTWQIPVGNAVVAADPANYVSAPSSEAGPTGWACKAWIGRELPVSAA